LLQYESVTLVEHTVLEGRSARDIASGVERAIRSGALAPGDRLPTVRGLAARLSLSPATVASAYRDLRRRGLVEGAGRHGTRVAPRPPVAVFPIDGPFSPAPAGRRDLTAGHPDDALLPRLRPLADQVDRPSRNYEAGVNDPALVAAAGRQFDADGVPSDRIAVVGGALDGVERVLLANLRPGDPVGVEDPGFPPLFDLLRALGLRAEPIAVDDRGPTPDGLDAALERGIDAFVLTPRGQNPTGAALDAERAAELRRRLRAAPDVLVVEDDHAVPVAGADAHTLWAPERSRWAVVRSVSKALGPDLRLAVAAGDEQTIARVAGRQALGTGWVSTILQRLVADLWADPATTRLVERATRVYAERRRTLVDALADRGIPAHGRSGLNVWIPVTQEAAVVAALAEVGWTVSAGERFRIASPPAIRVTVATMTTAEARTFADDLDHVLGGSRIALRRVIS
jgi:DNA-binding transcriptional MocR family regulator